MDKMATKNNNQGPQNMNTGQSVAQQKDLSAMLHIDASQKSPAEAAVEHDKKLKTDPKVTVIHGDLVLDHDTVFEGPLVVEGNIRGKDSYMYNLIVNGNINAYNIDALDIVAQNIVAQNIYALDIVAVNIDAADINAWSIKAADINAHDIKADGIEADLILCESLVQDKDATLACKTLITKKSTYKKQKTILRE